MHYALSRRPSRTLTPTRTRAHTQIPPPIQPPSRFPRKSFIADQFFSGGSSAVRSELGHTYYRQQRPLQGRLSTFYPNATTESGYPFHMFAF